VVSRNQQPGRIWIVERTVQRNDAKAQDVLIDLGSVELDSSYVVAERLVGLVRELVATYQLIDPIKGTLE
jgi:hypothetical protein